MSKSRNDHHDITVLKVGGARLVSKGDLDRLADQVIALRRQGRRVIVVHGGGPEISDLHDQLGIPFVKVDGLRATTDDGMEATIMILNGVVRSRILSHFAGRGVAALGVSGLDLGLLRAPFADLQALGRVGGPPTVATGAFHRLLDLETTIVLSPVSIGPDAKPVNVNADDAAHAVATALDARSLDFVTDISGVRTGPDRVVRSLDPAAVSRLVTEGVVHGGMVPKLRAAVAAVDAGVGRVRIGNLASMAAGLATEITAGETLS